LGMVFSRFAMADSSISMCFSMVYRWASSSSSSKATVNHSTILRAKRYISCFSESRLMPLRAMATPSFPKVERAFLADSTMVFPSLT